MVIRPQFQKDDRVEGANESALDLKKKILRSVCNYYLPIPTGSTSRWVRFMKGSRWSRIKSELFIKIIKQKSVWSNTEELVIRSNFVHVRFNRDSPIRSAEILINLSDDKWKNLRGPMSSYLKLTMTIGMSRIVIKFRMMRLLPNRWDITRLDNSFSTASEIKTGTLEPRRRR